jgi:heme oxygenase
LLREDLAFLRDPNDRHPGEGRDPGSQGTSFLALDPGLRRDDGVAPDDAAIAGTLYVLEGSRLGGRFLARRLAAGFPRAYLDSNQSAAKWQQLLGLLDEALYDPQTFQTALTAADAVFAAFARSADHWLTKG